MKWLINLLFGTFLQGYFLSLATRLGRIIVSIDGEKISLNYEFWRFNVGKVCIVQISWCKELCTCFKSLCKCSPKTCMTNTADIYQYYYIIHNNKDLIMQKNMTLPMHMEVLCYNSLSFNIRSMLKSKLQQTTYCSVLNTNQRQAVHDMHSKHCTF